MLRLPQGLAPHGGSQAAPELGPEGMAWGTPCTLHLEAAVVSLLQCPAPVSSQSTWPHVPIPLSPSLTP